MWYSAISHPDINNGLGCRVTLWTSGCSHNCPGCHNPETHSPFFGRPYDVEAQEKLFKLIDKPYIKGLTLSGGDPMYNPKDIEKLVSDFRKRFGGTKDIWLYTGYELHEIYDENPWLKDVDYIVSGRFRADLRDTSLAFRGSSNQVVWKNTGNTFLPENL